MQSFTTTFPAWAIASAGLIGVAATLSSQVPVNPLQRAPALAAPALTAPATVPVPVPVPAPAAKATQAAKAAIELKRTGAPSLRIAPQGKPAIGLTRPEDALRSQLKFETVRWGGKPVQTLDEASRILLAQAAAEKAGLREVGLSFHDVYGVIDAETSWISRTGSSKDGTPNLGLAQFEPRTARGLGVEDPHDPVQAVFGAAMYMKDGAKWASRKIGHLNLDPEQRAAKLREGVSVYYNLSVKGRNKWDGLNTGDLPLETQRHIRNAVEGAMEAAQLARQLKA